MEIHSFQDLANVPLPYLLAGMVPVVLVLGFVVLAFFGKRMWAGGGYLALALSGGAFVVSIAAAILFKGGSVGPVRVYSTWFSIDGAPFTAGFILNLFQLLMLLLVTGVTFLVHVFSLAYIEKDPMRHRYWAYLSLFSAAMCGLVIADNLLLVFVFWELVGFASWLLIGFWFKEKLPAMASQKAFIVNRIADAGFIMALMMIWMNYGSFVPFEWFPNESVDGEWVQGKLPFLISLGLFVGAIGKSAQFPFQIWLPDAMAGPTPVSSLIHAATMVAAGVYLLFSTYVFFGADMHLLMAVVGAFTALIAAISALTQTDIKRVLAYSTVSQLGFMIMGLGVSQPFYSFFHLLIHASFKCGLFLVAGVVIHNLHKAQHDEHVHFDVQDMRFMGGLRKRMPLAFIAWLFFAASMCGLPFFAGFLSKDGLLMGAIAFGMYSESGTILVPIMAIVASALTAFYITRQGMLVFFGKNRAVGAGASSEFESKISKTDWRMAVPLVVLACFALWVPFSWDSPLHAHWGKAYLEDEDVYPWIFTAISLCGIGLAAFVYRKGPLPSRSDSWWFNLSFEHFYFDQMFTQVLVKPFLALGRFFAWLDKFFVDGAVHVVAGFILRKGNHASLSSTSDWADHHVIDGIANGVIGEDGNHGLSKSSAWVDAHLIDGLANSLIQKNDRRSLSRTSHWLDEKVIDRVVNGFAGLVMKAGKRAGKLQTGKLQLYIIYTLLALLILMLILMYIFVG
jgi:NADH-quinone oxidoreductase subunit L